MKVLPGRKTCEYGDHIRRLQAEFNLIFDDVDRVVSPLNLALNESGCDNIFIGDEVNDISMRLIYQMHSNGWPTIGQLRGKILPVLWLTSLSRSCEALYFNIPFEERTFFVRLDDQTSFVTQAGVFSNFTDVRTLIAEKRVSYMTRLDITPSGQVKLMVSMVMFRIVGQTEV
jgi:hypothetical protein